MRLFFCLLAFCSACLLQATPPIVLVSVAPHAYLVKKVAGDAVSVDLLVPQGASFHTYEPTPKQVLRLGNAAMWFTIGESFEEKVKRALIANRPDLQIVDMTRGVNLIYAPSCHCHKNSGSADLHIWLSPKECIVQVDTIVHALSGLLPDNKNLFEENARVLKGRLEKLQEEFARQLAPFKGRALMASHPAYAYYCRDYSLVQLSVELEGRDPSPKQLTSLLNLARQQKITTIFIQPQYNNKGAKIVAEAIQAKVLEIDPYREDVEAMLQDLTNLLIASFANG